MKKGRHGMLGSLFVLILPLGIFFAITATVVLRYPDSDALHVAAFLVALILASAAQLLVFEWKIVPNVIALERFRELLADQERGARLLVRRDLELTRANDQLRKLDETKSSFISVVAHQLRTPLSGIKWTLNLLINGDMGTLTAEQRTFLIKAYESNDRMISLVNRSEEHTSELQS